MNELDLDSFEISIKSDIKGIKPKAKRRGYAKELVEKLHPTIERALGDGCSFEQIVEVLLQRNIKISASTLKRYYKANEKMKTNSQIFHSSEEEQESENSLDRSQLDLAANRNVSNKISRSSQIKQASVLRNGNRISISDILSNSAVTEEDYADDFNDY